MRRTLWAFIHIEKCAGLTMSHILRRTYGIRHCGVRPLGRSRARRHPLLPSDLRFALRLHPIGLRSISGHSVTPYTGLEEVVPIRYFTLLRDPIKQCASYYQYLVDRHDEPTDFDTWIHTEWPRNMQCKRLAGVADADMAISIIRDRQIFVGLVEEFETTLSLLRALCISDLKTSSYRTRNVAPRDTVARKLLGTPRTLELLAQATEEDTKLYQYAQKVLFPGYQERAVLADPPQIPGGGGLGTAAVKFSEIANLAYRNLVYKAALRVADNMDRAGR